jgi:hypothetical protein
MSYILIRLGTPVEKMQVKLTFLYRYLKDVGVADTILHDTYQGLSLGCAPLPVYCTRHARRIHMHLCARTCTYIGAQPIKFTQNFMSGSKLKMSGTNSLLPDILSVALAKVILRLDILLSGGAPIPTSPGHVTHTAINQYSDLRR